MYSRFFLALKRMNTQVVFSAGKWEEPLHFLLYAGTDESSAAAPSAPAQISANARPHNTQVLVPLLYMLPPLDAQDSPVFSFLNNLSPIEPLRSSAYSTNSLQGFQSINITSISSIFTSPHDNVSKEPRLPK